jgi:hypothetical protein
MSAGGWIVKPAPWRYTLAALSVAACTTHQVRGSIDGPTGTEAFVGTAHGSVVDKSGNLTFTTNSGVVCSGRFVYLTAEAARGTFDCGNGQGGPFDLTRTGDRWVGTGIVGNRRVTIELGHL